MYTYLEIVSGPNKGMAYRVRPGLRVGSGDYDLQLVDPSVPPLHSQVMLDQEDRFVLVCTNAVYEMRAGGQTFKKVLLQKGMVIQIGNAFLGVKSSVEPLMGALDPLLVRQNEQKVEESLVDEQTKTQTQLSKAFEIETPKKLLLNELENLMSQPELMSDVKLNPPSFKLFKNPLHLKVESGPHADDEYVISWGPRDFGPLSLEFPVDYPPFPGILFTLTPGSEGEILFSTIHPKFCKVNGQDQQTSVLREGSQIIAGNSTIKINYLKETDLE